MARLPNDDVLVGGNFVMPTAGGAMANCIARWNGSTWSALGGGFNLTVFALHVLPNGDVLAGGNFTTADGLPANSVARWNGTAWSPLPGLTTGSQGVRAFAQQTNGDLVAGGDFTVAGWSACRVVRWTGTQWLPLGMFSDDSVNTLTVLPNGDLLAGSRIAPTSPQLGGRIARWNGTQWTSLGTGMDDRVNAMLVLGHGEVLVGGQFSAVDKSVSRCVARLTTDCPASIASAGAGCSSSGGTNTLVATTLPWTGSLYRAHASGLPLTAFVMHVVGFAPTALPLLSLFPQAGSGCVLRAAPDVTSFVLSSAGVADVAIALPNTPSLAGMVVYEQLVPIEFDASPQIVAVTATNALQLTIGSF